MYKKLKLNCPIWFVGILAVLVLSGMVNILYKNGIPQIGDTSFHMDRVYEIREAFKAHHIPSWLNFSSFFGMGQAVSGMYPDITLWPLVLITIKLGFLHQILAIRILILISTFVVNYFCLSARGFVKEYSFFIAIIYAFSGYSLYQFLFEFQPGTAVINIFAFPIALSIHDLLNENRIDKYLVVKLSLLFGIIVYSHLLSIVVFAIIILSFWVIKSLYLRKVNKYSIINLLFSILLTIIYSLPILLRLIIISSSHISSPYGKEIVESENIYQVLFNPNTYSRTSLSLIALVFLVIVIWLRPYKQQALHFIIAEIILMLFCTNLFPWVIFQKIPLINMLQYTPWRFGIWLSVLPLVAFLYIKTKHKRLILFLLALLTLAAIPEISRQKTDMNFSFDKGAYFSLKNTSFNSSWRSFETPNRDYLPYPTIGATAKNVVPKYVQNQLYSPVIKNNHGGEEKVIKNSESYSGITLYTKKSLRGKNYTLPIYYYPSLKYDIEINNKSNIKVTQSKNGFMKINTKTPLRKKSKITVYFKNPTSYKILLLISLSSYALMCLYLFLLGNSINSRIIK